ncbi:RagB/SusD family nutrient uptake outer membrane protein [Maribacter sp.]|uniref:RagB/SusD family nutrient uptake outer membrane protein n=1 Tax=Maribacter sp. TaxID=1897614 RepID=UPI0025C1FE9D|nr:RagB/SusD family nutrient uptake outer membrane protein [Maribacter sp.]
MKFKIKNIAYFAIATLLFASCELDEQRPISTTSFENFYKTPDDAKTALNGIYSRFRNASNLFYLYGDMRSELVVQGDLGAGSDVNRNTITQNTTGSDWASFYEVNNAANLLLENIDDIEFVNESDKNAIKAEALTLRAFTYFYMVRIWGDVPLITIGISSSTQEEVSPESRTSSEEVYTQIISDINQAKGLFSSEGIKSKYSISKPALSALEADVFLWKSKVRGGGDTDLATALTAVNSAIDNSGAVLLSSYADVFRSTEATGEDVFSVFYSQVEQAKTPFWAADFLISGEFFNLLSDESKEVTPLVSITQGKTVAQFFTTSDVFRGYFDELNDEREELYFLDITYSDNTNSHVFNKFIGSLTGPGTRQFTDDVKIYRLADLILLKAEILNAQDNPSAAVTELNKVRTRAGIGAYLGTVAKADIDTAILKERAKELGFEGKRWFDLIRFGEVSNLVPNMVGVDSQKYLWPISAETRSLNSKLKQTPGY